MKSDKIRCILFDVICYQMYPCILFAICGKIFQKFSRSSSKYWSIIFKLCVIFLKIYMTDAILHESAKAFHDSPKTASARFNYFNTCIFLVIWHGTQWLKGKEAKRGHILDKSNWAKSAFNFDWFHFCKIWAIMEEWWKLLSGCWTSLFRNHILILFSKIFWLVQLLESLLSQEGVD